MASAVWATLLVTHKLSEKGLLYQVEKTENCRIPEIGHGNMAHAFNVFPFSFPDIVSHIVIQIIHAISSSEEILSQHLG